MSETTKSTRGWLAAVGAVAAAYGYFLIFGEFALLRLAERFAGGWPLRVVMAGLGAGGIAGSVAAAWGVRAEPGARTLAAGFIMAAGAAGLTLGASEGGWFFAAAVGVGWSLGWVTVTLAAVLRAAVGARGLGLACGVGTGLAYAACNLPVVFEASAQAQTWGALLAALGGAAATRWLEVGEPEGETTGEFRGGAVVAWVAMLLALVWADSAAFYVIQHTAGLKATTWSGAWTLGGNAATHLGAAVAAGWALDRGGAERVMAAATVLLLGACAWLRVAPAAAVVPVLYTSGVSLYSTVLVWYPARSGRAGVAAVIYGVAGWIGSALGIGMAQDLRRIPGWFLVAAAAVIAGALLARRRALATLAVGGVFVLAAGPELRAEDDAAVRLGREVYVAEGCLHCHSQYVRPALAAEVVRWGPATALREAKAESPPLFGNRRQGPDLAAVGNRRSSEWQRLHLRNPRALVPGSRMPAYDYLFAGDAGRGEALVAYLASLGAETLTARLAVAAAWRPEARTREADAARGAALFAQWCAGCHGAGGRGDGTLAAQLSVRPPDWTRDAWRWVRPDEPEVETALARIVRFGLPGSPMAGHEYFTDAEAVALARYVQGRHNSSLSLP